MKTLDFNLPDSKNGGKITAFNYSHSLNELVGSWSANIAGGTFKAGNSISFGNVLKNAIITRAYKDSSGLWHIEGKDAGVKLMRSTPDAADLPKGDARTVIRYLAEFCDIDSSISVGNHGLTGFNVRSVITGSTCAEAILELAMFSGYIAFIDNNGKLNVKKPALSTPSFSGADIIDDSGSDFDLDGYATHVLVSLTRKNVENDSGDDDEQVEYYSGTTPSTNTEIVSYSGLLPNGHYSYDILKPFNVTKRAYSSITQNGVTVTNTEEHNYDYKHKTIWRDNTEYVLFAFCEKSYTLTRITEGEYTTQAGNTAHFKETTTETMQRSFSGKSNLGVPDDWTDEIDFVSSESIQRSTVREGSAVPDDNMPAYAPPFDSQITRTFTRSNFGKSMFCNEVEQSYEARQVGSIAPIKVEGKLVPHFLQGSNLAIQTHSTPQWVLVNRYTDYYEQYNDDGDCIISTKSEYNDDGSKWMSEHSMNSTGDDNLDALQEAYAKFSQLSNGLEVNIAQSNFSANQWQFIELQGRTKSYTQQTTVLDNVSEWYDNGQYIYFERCPHYKNSSCTVFALDENENPSIACFRKKGTLFWTHCPRAEAALNLARQNDNALINSIIIGTASASGLRKKFVGYQRDIYIDEVISDSDAQIIADNIAENILAIKGKKGIRKTVTVPYDPSYSPNGWIIDVAHDWENLTTSVTYLDETDNLPDFFISQNVASIAAFVAARENSRHNSSHYGKVTAVSSNTYTVNVAGALYKCSTKLKNVRADDIVLVQFPAGNKLAGVIINRL